jgi:hypothetical protein
LHRASKALECHGTTLRVDRLQHRTGQHPAGRQDSTSGIATGPTAVRRQYHRLRPLVKLGAEMRGWTLDVLNVVRSLGKSEFSLAEIYAHEHEVTRLHPQNRHVGDKIRQQLQVLRDVGLVQFLGAGSYRIR